MRRAAAALAATLASGVAWADSDTYCVGGYNGRPPNAAYACSSPAVRKAHFLWHFHMWVKRGDTCMACFDELDNSCESHFLRSHPNFREVTDPARECARASTADQVWLHLDHGRDLTPRPPPPPPPPEPARAPSAGDAAGGKPPGVPRPSASDPTAPTAPTKDPPALPPPAAPPPPPARLTPRLDRVPPGPHAAGDTVTLRGSLRDEQGEIVAVEGGTFTLTLADGSRLDVPGTLTPDGGVQATVALPASSTLQVQFTPDTGALPARATLTSTSSASATVAVEVCALRARIDRPTAGASWVGGQPAALAVTLTDPSGAAVAAPAGLALTWTLTPADAPPVTLSAGPDGAAQHTPPEALIGQTVRVSVGGEVGGRAVCAAEEVDVTVTALGLGLDASNLPSTCYVGIACAGAARLIRPDGAARAQVDQLLAAPDAVVVLFDGAEEIARSAPSPDDTYRFDRRYDLARHADWRLEVHHAGVVTALPMHEVEIKPALKLQLPALLDWGAVQAGTPFASACVTLDFSETVGALDHGWRIEVTGLEGCSARPVIAFRSASGGASRASLEGGVEVAQLDPDRPVLDLCLETTGCAGEAGPPDARLRVRPTTPVFADQVRDVQLRWTVTGVGFWACYGPWLGPLAALLAIAFIAYGFIRPHRLPPHAAVRVAGNVAALKRAQPIVLVDVPGSGAGWYRDARLSLTASGELSRRDADAAVSIRATATGVVLVARGALEAYDKRKSAWSPVEDAARHTPSATVVYRVGAVHFQVEV
jgi:hypothetical protein